MKKIIKNSLAILIISICFSSCSTLKKLASELETELDAVDEKIETIIEDISMQEPEPVPEPEPEPTAEELFIEKISNVNIRIVSSPKEVLSGRSFTSPYEILVQNGNEPAANFPITIEYPAEKDKFASIDVLTSGEGTYSFMPEKTQFAANTIIKVYPTPLNDDSQVLAAVEEKYEIGTWKVKSKTLYDKGAILFVWNMNERGKPVNNSYELLSELRSKVSMNFGNAPVNEQSYIGLPLSTLYKENNEYIEGYAYGFLIAGTIRFTQPVEKVEGTDDYLCSLIADISAVDMKNGKEVFSETFSNEALGSNWNQSTSACKKQLAKKIVDGLIYGL